MVLMWGICKLCPVGPTDIYYKVLAKLPSFAREREREKSEIKKGLVGSSIL
jgi:hypothetical protein